MFRLQRLEISGFKSFADYTEIVFTGDGITAVVGPNGCGKSNVADAISWVLGEQKPKTLRGDEMQDVIFQGTSKRPAGGMAEVILHLIREDISTGDPEIEQLEREFDEFDEGSNNLISDENWSDEDRPLVGEGPAGANNSFNPDLDAGDADHGSGRTIIRSWRRRKAALDFAPGEVASITRRLYRSGESEYLLNGRTCRLRDIRDLLSGTGLSGTHYAIIEQGRIGQILSAKPMDRRSLIEEAAGISKFRARQRIAEARLESARSNLRRVSDIVAEVEKSSETLRRQAAKAGRYQRLQEEFRGELRKMYRGEEKSLSAALGEAQQRLGEVEFEEQQLSSELKDREEAARQATMEARNYEHLLQSARASLSEMELQSDREERECGYLKEQIIALSSRRSELGERIDIINARLESAGKDIQILHEHSACASEGAEKSSAILKKADASYNERLGKVIEAEARVEAARADLLSCTIAAERLAEMGRQTESSIARVAAQCEGFRREEERARIVLSDLSTKVDVGQAEVAQGGERLAALQAERETLMEKVASARTVVSIRTSESTQAREDAARLQHRLDTLVDLDAKRAFYSHAVQRLFSDEANDEKSRDFFLISTLADMLQVHPAWESAVEGVLGSFLQAVMVPTAEDALRAAAWLESHGEGRATFLVTGLHGGSGLDDVASYPAVSSTSRQSEASGACFQDVLGLPAEIRDVLRRTLSREMSARICSDLDECISVSVTDGELWVTEKGEWVLGGELVSAGGPLSVTEGAGLLTLKREMRDLELSAHDMNSRAEEIEEAARSARQELAQLEDELLLLTEALGREEREHLAREMNVQQLVQENERAERHLKVVVEDLARLGNDDEELKRRLTLEASEARRADEARREAKQGLEAALERLAVERYQAQKETENLGNLRAAAAAAAERERAVATELHRLEVESEELSSDLERLHGALAETDSLRDQLETRLSESRLRRELMEAERLRRELESEELAKKVESSRSQADEISNSLSELNRNAAALRDNRSMIEVQRAELIARSTYLGDMCIAELNEPLQTVAESCEADELEDLAGLREKVETLRSRIAGFGAVNMMALEELSGMEERLHFLLTQREDITAGISSSEEALGEIKRRSSERFSRAFAEINQNFKRFFVDLFGGGHGEMSLIDSEDPLESGVEIVAQPPGKRLQNLLLLSGGEKAMTALCLVLGIFCYRPSPFCLLDEVDAPLDEANVGRFAEKIVELSTGTQFIVITHNKKTMEIARALYGVTMEHPGISRLVSVKFD